MQPVLLLNVVGLTPRQLSGDHTPHLSALARRGACAPMSAVLPAVTCSAQASMLTGLLPSQHGAVGNGWLDRESMELALWRQSNSLVRGPKLYDRARALNADFSCAKIFWWWNMGAAVDWSITPRPFYPADGRKIPAIYAWPTSFGVETEAELGAFPFFDFWGPRSGLPSSQWIAQAAVRTLREKRPTLTMAYLPHLDYDHQRYGPLHARSRQALSEIDQVVGELISAADGLGVATVVVSEYGLTAVDTPVELNLALREAGLLVARATPTGEVLDLFGSRAFALADHQVAHVYLRQISEAQVRELLESLPGVESVLGQEQKRAVGLDHARAGDLVLVADPRAWFTYRYWSDPAAEPDFARTVDIHRKPGYDPCELFVDPSLRAPKLRVARRLAQKKLGMRYLMDVIPVAPEFVKGSHGRLPDDRQDGPVFLCSEDFGAGAGPEPQDGQVQMTSVADRVLGLIGLPAD